MTTLHFQNIKADVLKDPEKLQSSPIRLCLNIETKIQAKILKERIRINEFFRDYDKLRKGYTSYAYFTTALNTLNIGLEEHEIKQLVTKYSLPDGNIDYVSFCDNIDVVFTENSDVKEVVKSVKSSAVFNEEEQKIATQVLDTMRQLVSNNRILLKPIFQDFDKTKVGHVTDFQFSRVLKQTHLMPLDAEFELLTRKYKDLNNLHEINYIEFLVDVDKPMGVIDNKPFQFTTTPEFYTKPQVSQVNPESIKATNVLMHNFLDPTTNLKSDPNNVEDRIQALVVMKGIRIEEFFKDFDKLKKGTVTKQKLRSVTAMLGINMTESEYNKLEDKYATSDGLFNYSAFCHNINSIFTNVNLQKEPTTDVKQHEKTDTLLARKCELPVDQKMGEEIQSMLEGIIRCMKVRRISMKPFFQNFDIPKSGYVTKSQFSRVLSEVGIHINEAQLSTLLKHYMNRGTLDEVNYVEFIIDIEKLDPPFQPIYKETSYEAAVNHINQVHEKKEMVKTILKHNPKDIEDVLARIRGSVKEQRIRISEFMRDYDKLRSGYITTSQLRIALNMAKIGISDTEFNLLVDEYGNEDKSKFKWKEFSDIIDEVFTVKQLEKAVDVLPQKISTETKFWKPVISEEDKEILAKVMSKFKEFMVIKKINPRPFFQEWDKHNSQKVSPKQFRQVLTVLGFSLTEHEALSITKNYSNDKKDVMYQAFLSDCGFTPMIGVDGQDFTKDFHPEQPIPEIPQKQVQIENLLLKIKNTAKMNRLRMIEFFQDYDPLRKGCVAQPKFRGALEALKLNLATEEYALLEAEFKSSVDSYKIDYVHLCDDIESIFTNKELQKKPVDDVQNYELSKIVDPEDVLNAEEEKQLDIIMKRLAVIVKAKHILIKPMFQDKDKAKCGIVQDTRFRSVLDFHGMHLSEEEHKLLHKRYKVE